MKFLDCTGVMSGVAVNISRVFMRAVSRFRDMADCVSGASLKGER